MARTDSREQMDNAGGDATKRSGETHSGNPNPAQADKARSTEHKSTYGGDGGEPRTSPDTESTDTESTDTESTDTEKGED